jgi:hypothetical protein
VIVVEGFQRRRHMDMFGAMQLCLICHNHIVVEIESTSRRSFTSFIRLYRSPRARRRGCVQPGTLFGRKT